LNCPVQGSDQHVIIDLISGEIINNYKSISLEEHVWLCRGVTLMPNITIGNGGVIGTQSLVTKSIPEKTISTGIPTKITKKNMSWSRLSINLDPTSTRYVNYFSISKR